MLRLLHLTRRAVASLLVAMTLIFGFAAQATAHPLGNFTINHFARIEVGGETVKIRYVVDMAEIPTFQELQSLDVDGQGKPTSAALDAYLERVAQQYAAALVLTMDGTRIPLEISAKRISMPTGVGGLATLRVECDLAGKAPVTSDANATATHLLQFEDTNYAGRTGWREIVISPAAGVTIFNSTAYGSSLSDELKAYPEDKLFAPLDERTAKLSWTRDAAAPAGATTLLKRDGRPATESRDMFAELMSREDLTLGVALVSLLMAVGLGALHAFSPGHGKTVVGAYLVGSRGTPRHALFLGLTVTITHTLGVFALGLVTLFASQYIVPEKLFPILGVISGAIVVVIGLSLFARRLRVALGRGAHDHTHHSHDGAHSHDHAQDGHEHSAHHHHDDGDPTIPHSHDGGSEHTHLPPGADGSAITWKSLLALGISGGLLPCPSALVVLLSAITMQRVGFGILLVIAFSIGLAATLTGVGLAFLYAGRFFKRPKRFASGRLVRVLPAVSAFVIMCVGLLICYEALVQGGFNLSAMFSQLGLQGGEIDIAGKGALAILGIGLVLGLKHATEVDHVVAVSTVVSEHRNLRRAALVGGLWGAGHTMSLIVVGVVVLAFRIAIPDLVAGWLEFGVALMIIGLGLNAFLRALRRRSDIHVHQHGHDGTAHAHIHFHDKDTEHSEPVTDHSHASTRVGIKPFLVGAMHGLAGSAALTLLILTQIESPMLGLLYLAVFGVGSIIGMLLMSGLVALPFIFSARKLTGIHYGLQAVAGVLSIAFGFWYAYQSGIASGLFGKTF